jgi:hypothetical protein
LTVTIAQPFKFERLNLLLENTGGNNGGSEQIRTAVEAFAELCLTARPRNLLRWSKVVYSD